MEGYKLPHSKCITKLMKKSQEHHHEISEFQAWKPDRSKATKKESQNIAQPRNNCQFKGDFSWGSDVNRDIENENQTK